MTIVPLTAQNGDELSREELLAHAVDRFNTGPTRWVSRLSTAFLCTPIDFSKEHLLTEKITDAMNYSTSLVDVEAMNALRHLPKDPNANYATQGLYLYLADAISRANPETTFLTAMRDTPGAMLPVGVDYEREDLLRDITAALQKVGVTGEPLRVLKEWHDTGSYTIAGAKHSMKYDKPSDTETIEGPYIELAKKISKRQNKWGMGPAISYALGNKLEVAALPDDAAALEHTKKTLDEPDLISRRIEHGDVLRKRRLYRAALDIFTDEEIAHAMIGRKEEEKAAEGIFKHFPDEALKLLLTDRYHTIYTAADSIKPVFPDHPLPGLDETQTKQTRDSKGVHLDRYRTLFLSDGIREDKDKRPKPFVNDEERYMSAAQTALHETFHIASHYLTDSELTTLSRKVDELGKQVAQSTALANTTSLALPANNLQEILNPKAFLYENYTAKTSATTPQEEVLCNLYGLAHTELKGSPLLDEAPLLRPLIERLNAAVETALKEAVKERDKANGKTNGNTVA